MHHAVDDVIAVCRDESIDCDIVKAGVIYAARSKPQFDRLRTHLELEREWGFGEADYRWLEHDELAARVRVNAASGAIYSPHCARVQPAKLTHGVAAAVERLGVTIYEASPVTRIELREAHTIFGVVRATHVLRATEGFTAGLEGQKRTMLPMNSSMIATEPLPASFWDHVGWSGCELLSDGAHVYCYAQRTADNRIAIGGRGVPYLFGSRTDERGRTHDSTARLLRAMVEQLFPLAAGVGIAHAWCGVLGVPRDWCTSVGLDRGTGLGFAGGYVGSGLTTTNLAGRTLADLVLGRESELTRLAWVNRTSRKWEPEPLRWLGVHGIYSLYRAADRREQTIGTTSRFAKLAAIVSGQ